MCIAVAAKILETDAEQKTAKAELNGNILNVNIRLVTVKPGDYVLVHAGCAVEVLQRDSAEEILALYRELEELSADDT